MILQVQPRLRRLILIGTPLLTGILLLFHPVANLAETAHVEHPRGMDVYAFIAPVADRFLAVHALFALALALLGLSFIFVFHAPPLGPIAMLLFLLAVVAMERAGSPVGSGKKETNDEQVIIQYP